MTVCLVLLVPSAVGLEIGRYSQSVQVGSESGAVDCRQKSYNFPPFFQYKTFR